MTEPDVKACCADEDNLDREEVGEDLVIHTCRECKCRHFILTVDPAKLGIVVN